MRALIACAALAWASGCAHTILVKSDPPGAIVTVDGKEVGKTPCSVVEETGGGGLVVVELHAATSTGERSQRLAYERSGFAPSPILAGIVVGAATLLVGATLLIGSVVAFPFIIIGTVATLGLLAPLALGVGALYILGVVMLATGPQIPMWTIGFYGRQGPDAIDVDFTHDTPAVKSSPPGMVVPLLGHSPVPGVPAPNPG